MYKICFTLPHSPEAVSRVAEEERPDDAAGVEERLRERRLPGVVANPIHLNGYQYHVKFLPCTLYVL